MLSIRPWQLLPSLSRSSTSCPTCGRVWPSTGRSNTAKRLSSTKSLKSACNVVSLGINHHLAATGLGCGGSNARQSLRPILCARRIGQSEGAVMLGAGPLKRVAHVSQLPHSALPQHRMGQNPGAHGLRCLLSRMTWPAPDRQCIPLFALSPLPVHLCRLPQVPYPHLTPPDYHSIGGQLPFELRFEITQPTCLAIIGIYSTIVRPPSAGQQLLRTDYGPPLRRRAMPDLLALHSRQS
jgi:hypothetical protein